VKTKWLDGELWTDEKAVAAMEAGFNEQGQAMYEVLKQLRLVGPESISTGEEYSGNCLRIEDLGMMSANVKQKKLLKRAHADGDEQPLEWLEVVISGEEISRDIDPEEWLDKSQSYFVGKRWKSQKTVGLEKPYCLLIENRLSAA